MHFVNGRPKTTFFYEGAACGMFKKSVATAFRESTKKMRLSSVKKC